MVMVWEVWEVCEVWELEELEELEAGLDGRLLHSKGSQPGPQASMISAILIIDQSGQVIISRYYRDNVR